MRTVSVCIKYNPTLYQIRSAVATDKHLKPRMKKMESVLYAYCHLVEREWMLTDVYRLMLTTLSH